MLWWQQFFTVMIPNFSTFQVLITAGCYFNDNELQQNASVCDDSSLLLYWYRNAEEHIRLWWQQFVTLFLPNCSRTYQVVMTAVCYFIDTEMQKNTSGCDDSNLLLYCYRTAAEHIKLWWQQFVTVLIPNCNRTYKALMTAGFYWVDSELQHISGVGDSRLLL